MEESLEIYRAAGDREGEARVLNWLAHGAVALGELVEARKIKVEALELARELGNKDILWSALTSMSELERYEGNLETAQPLYEEALTVARELNAPLTIRVGTHNLAMLHIQMGDLGTAGNYIGGALKISMQFPATKGALTTMDTLSALVAASGDYPIAARLAGASQAEMDRLGISRDVVDEKFFRHWLDRARKSMGEEAFVAENTAGRSLTIDQALAEAREWLENHG
jgi:tetratricopeptide (TPR) repeat protein